MQIVLSPHARARMRERSITERDVRKTIEHPDRIEHSVRQTSRVLVKRVYTNRKLRRSHLMLVVYERRRHTVSVVTVIDTSKIAKYL